MKKFFSVLIALLPFFYQYKSPISVVSFGEFILIPFILYFLLLELSKGSRISLKYSCGLYDYLLMAIFVSIFASIQVYFSIGSFITVVVRIVYYIILTYIASKYAKLDILLRTLEFATIFFSIYALIQYFVHLSTGGILPTVINKNWVFEVEAGGRLDYANYYRWLYRPSSLFVETGYFAGYVSVGLSSFLFNKNTKKRTIYGLFVTLALVVCASSAGFAMFIILWAIYIYNIVFKDKKSTAKKLIFVLLFIALIIIILSSSLATTLLERTKAGGSFNNRILRTYLLIKSMNPYQFLFGIGINNVEGYIRTNDLYTVFDEDNLNYVSSVMGTFLCSGIFTFVFYIRFYVKSFFLDKNIFPRTLVVLLFFRSFIGNTSYTYYFFFIVIIVFLIFQDDLKKRRNIDDINYMSSNR